MQPVMLVNAIALLNGSRPVWINLKHSVIDLSSISEASTAIQETAPSMDATKETLTEAATTVQETGKEAVDSTKEMAANSSAAVQDMAAKASTTGQETAAEVSEEVASDIKKMEKEAKEMGITFDGDHSPIKAGAEVTREAAASSSSWMDQMRDGFNQGFNAVSETTKQGYERAKTMMNSPETQTWTASLKDGFHQGITTVSEKTSQGYNAAKEYIAGTGSESSTNSNMSWIERLQSNFTMCLNTVHEKTAQGYEATMELVVGKSDQPLASPADDAFEESLTEKAGSEIDKALKTSKGMSQEAQDGAQSAVSALKPKSVKVGGAWEVKVHCLWWANVTYGHFSPTEHLINQLQPVVRTWKTALESSCSKPEAFGGVKP